MGTGVGEAMLIGAAVGAGTGAVGSAIQGGDVMQGALMGGALGGIGGGVGSAFGAAGGAAAGGAGSSVTPTATALAGGAGTAVTPTASALAGAGAAPAATFGSLSAAPTAGTFGALSATPVSGATYGALSAPASGALGSSSGIIGGMPSTAGITAGGGTGTISTLPGNFTGYAPQLSNTQLAMIGGGSALGAMMEAERNKYGMPDSEPYTGGSLSRFRYNPATYRPDVVRPPNPVYKPIYAAEGGIMNLVNKPTYPQSGIDRTQYAVPSQMPTSAEVIASDYDAQVNPYTGMAKGGIADLGGYSDGGRMLKGPGDGMSDSIPGVIGGKQPARLADGEFVVPADVVSHLGNGSTDAGAKQLYSMMDKVRKARTGKKAQGREINPRKYMPA